MLSDESLMALLLFLRTVRESRHAYKRTRSMGVRPISKRRRKFGDGHNLLAELRYLPDCFQHYTRLNLERFEYLVNLLAPIIEPKQHSKTAIPTGHRLSMTLRYLATGDTFSSLGFAYRCGDTTVRAIVQQTMRAIVKVLLSKVVPEPSSEREWRFVAEGFMKATGLPHCLVAFDGRLMRITRPREDQDNFMSYKKFPATVLLALVAADYSFLVVDVGSEGSLSDSTILKKSVFWKKLKNGEVHIPPPETLPGSRMMCPYYFIGDRGFPMDDQLLTPYRNHKLKLEEAVFNFRLSKARVFAENGFGILVSRWRIYDKPLKGSLENVDLTVLATICLHNFIIRSGDESAEEEFVSNYLSSGVKPEYCHVQEGCGGHTKSGVSLRDKLAKYLSKEGAIPEQEQRAAGGYWGSKM